MKFIKKTAALALALLLCLTAVSCASDNGTPDGMKSATAAGEPFILYVPTSWNENTVSGMSSAYYSSEHKIMVTARYYTPADPSMTLDQYADMFAKAYSESLSEFTVTERAPAVLGGKDAVKLSYTAKNGETPMTCFMIATLHGGRFVSLNAYCTTELYEVLLADFDKIAAEFVLCEMDDGNGEEFVDKNTPEGMEIASAKQLEYRFYVPKTWVCDAESGASEAYYPESGRSNVTVTSYAPSVSISVKDYFIQCEAQYSASLPEYKRIGESERTVADRTAYSYTYTTVVDGSQYTIMQTLFAYNEMIYSITYTALDENFETHMSDVEAMLSAFTFR